MAMTMRKFPTGATRNDDLSKPDYEGFLDPAVLESYGEFMNRNRRQVDGVVRDSDNWQQGIPRDAYMKSLLRHMMDVWLHHRGRGTPTEDLKTALRAVMFNAMGYLHELLKEDAQQQEQQDTSSSKEHSSDRTQRHFVPSVASGAHSGGIISYSGVSCGGSIPSTIDEEPWGERNPDFGV